MTGLEATPGRMSMVAVIGVPDPKWGETPRAYVELKPGATVTEEELRVFCRGHIAGFKHQDLFGAEILFDKEAQVQAGYSVSLPRAGARLDQVPPGEFNVQVLKFFHIVSYT